MIDALATEPHFLDHIAPVWRQLPDAGRLWVTDELEPRAAALGLAGVSTGPPLPVPAPTLVASYGDLKRARRALRPVVLMEHGAGQAYAGAEDATGSYVGSRDRDGVVLVLVPNEPAAARQRAAHPRIPAIVIGSPHLDELAARPAPVDGPPAVSFHWDCYIAPETRSAWREYANRLHRVAEAFPGAIGHAHPRLWPTCHEWMATQGLRPLQEFVDVVDAAGVYCVDNSSTLFTFAALDRPVVVINSRHYRRSARHGGRFWDWADVGVSCDHPSELVDAITEARGDSAGIAARRREVAAEVYPHRGDAAARAAEAMGEILCSTR